MNFRECAPCFSHPLFVAHYIDDIVKSLFDKERNRRTFNFTSPQVGYRHLLVDFMQNFAAHLSFRRTTLHLGVYLLDFFMDNHSIALERLNIVSIVCLCLAAKVEEMEFKIPKISEITKLTNIECTLEDYLSLERMILEFFDWNIMQPTVVTYVELYIDAIISEEEFITYNSQVTDGILYKNLKSMKSVATSNVFEFLNLSLKCIKVSVETPSKLAATIIAASRYMLEIEPLWSDSLIHITGYELDSLEDLASELFRLKCMENNSLIVTDKKKNTPDSGYMSSKDTETETDTENESDESVDANKKFKSD